MENTREQARIGRRRLILFPLPLQGHISPMLQLANILHFKGFSITIVHTDLNSPDPTNYPHFTFYPIQDGLAEIDDGPSKTDVLSLLEILNAKCIEPFRQVLAELLADTSADPISCLVSDAVWIFTTEVCKSLKIPRIVLRTGGVRSFQIFAAFPFLLEKGYLPVQDDRLEDPVVELPPLRVKDLPVMATSEMEKLYELIQGMIKESKASSGIIWNSFQELEEVALSQTHQDFGIPVFPIGPFHKLFPASCSLLAEDHTSISWLDKHVPNSVVYVSFGSIAAIDEKDFLEVAWGLANSKHPFLWVVRPGLIRGADWLEPLPENYLEMLNGRGHIVKWAPQSEVLSHPSIGAFWTHCGWNSTLESICEGVPMICSPCFTDQLVNGRYVSHVWGNGLSLEDGFSREKIEMAIEMIMKENQGGEIREMALRLKEKASFCLKPGGSSFESLQSLVKFMSLF